MSERKVLNKYYPPDFDPSKIPRRKMGKDRQQVVRLMAPFSMQCKACSEFIYKGKKFNARKETAQGEVYFGIKIFRFYIKCPRCSNEITFKTDPKNTDYTAEHGAVRNFEPWREEQPTVGGDRATEDDDLARLEAVEQEALAEEDDAMHALEARQADSKREMDILDKLQEIRTRNARMERADTDAVLKTISSRVTVDSSALGGAKELEEQLRREREEEEDEAEVRRHFAKLEGRMMDIEIETAPGELPDIPEDEATDSDPVASGSGSRPSDDPSAIKPTAPVQTTVVKRKLDAIEPTALSLLSEDARKVASMDFSGKSSTAGGGGKKKKVGELGSKFGIKVVKKPKVKS